MFAIKDYVIGLMALSIVGGYFAYENALENLESKYDKKNEEYLTCKLNKATLTNALDKQNYKVTLNKMDLEEALEDLEEWRNKPKKVKYVTIYKTLKDKNITKGNCDETNNALKSISFSDL